MSSMSVVVPNHSVMLPSSPRIGAPRALNQR
jgi:hypothetical protein